MSLTRKYGHSIKRAVLLSQPSEIAQRGALYKLAQFQSWRIYYSALEKALLAEAVAQHTRDVRASDINRAAQLTYDIFVKHSNFRCDLQHNFKFVCAAEHMAKFAEATEKSLWRNFISHV
ncbi:putative sodium/potassium-transporting ATPase subunit [Trichinella spiralis]|uniref:Sodium/potassium-transporting ATPase subunit n=1 Tax=Trichinella spiralis TaxID=6334 RepID=A0ABR3KRJ9_TRISP